jgi:hypothetical protein
MIFRMLPLKERKSLDTNRPPPKPHTPKLPSRYSRGLIALWIRVSIPSTMTCSFHRRPSTQPLIITAARTPRAHRAHIPLAAPDRPTSLLMTLSNCMAIKSAAYQPATIAVTRSSDKPTTVKPISGVLRDNNGSVIVGV